MTKKSSKVDNDADFESALKSEPAVQVQPKFNPDSIALSSIRRPDGTFNLVSVEIDSTTLNTGKITVLDTADSKMEATEKFKMLVVRNGLI
jgi:hypothetical protein